MTASDTTQILTAATGVIGTTGGLLVSYLTLKHTYWQDKPDVKLAIDKSLLAFPDKVSDEMLTFHIANLGKQDYVVANLNIVVGRHSGGFFISKPEGTVGIPYTLKPGETCNFWIKYADLVRDTKKMTKRNRIKIRGHVKDYAGIGFDSKPHLMVLKETKLYKFKMTLVRTWKGVVKAIVP